MSKALSPTDSASAAFTRTERDQRQAADPAVSAWVSANAGAGKTHVLVTRLLRILLSGTPPERILCLTFTKAAAAEMAGRVFKRLAAWVTMGDDELREDLAKLDGETPSPQLMETARDLFARAMETPGGLKVQTIHAFCERLLQRFPLEAAVPPRFAILDDDHRAELLRTATDQVLMQAVQNSGSELGRAHAVAVRYAAEDRFDEMLRAALSRRKVLLDADRDFDRFTSVLRRHCGVAPDAEIGALEDALANVLNDATLGRARAALAAGSTNDRKCAAVLGRALGATSTEARIEALVDFFLTDKGQPRKSLVTKKTAADNGWLEPALTAAQAEFHSLHVAHRSLVVVTATLALVQLAAAVLQRYTQLKHARAALDFDDLIELSASLLKQPGHADWVLFKLDGGLDHILVDEAQDTSPQQWDVVTALANEFFSGAGAREDERPRTVFAVGDEKQSIYGFQGAEPKLFEEHGAHFERLVREAGQTWRPVPLQLSFRTVVPVLDAVDRVFADASRTPGVTSPDKAIRHISNRIGCAGLVELWEPEKHEEADAAEVWSPGSDSAPRGTVTRLAERIAKTIRHWIDSREMLASEGRPIRPGDVLILVRKRQPFADAMVAALEAQKVPVAGADRIRLTRQIAVRDLIVLGQFLLLPEDDLALATVLKSPLFDLDDADLIAIAPERKGTLWSALLRAADHAPRFRPAAETLKRWRSRSDLMPPFEFFSEVLDRDGMRSRLLTRLGPESSDAIDELLSLAISYDDSAPPSLQGFIHWLQESAHDIKRDLEHGRDEVRVMTVHGAKGLEAPIVFLPDTCSAAASGRGAGLLVCENARRPDGMPAPFIWPVRGATGLAFVDTARGDGRSRNTEEHHRLLYVALTRARDRLYVAGFEGKKTRGQDCWYDLVSGALGGQLVSATDAAGRDVLRLACAQEVPAKAPEAAPAGLQPQQPLPNWATRMAPAEPTRLVPLVPSRLAPLDSDAEGEPVEPPRPAKSYEPPAPSPSSGSDELRFLRGTLTHALLQHLPALDSSEWPGAAERLVSARGGGLTERVRSGIVAETLAVLADPVFADLFGRASRAEVPIVAELTPPKGAGPTLRVTGQIDRLVQLPDRVLIVDYKTNRPPPADTASVPETYLLQLAAYRLAVGQIFAPLPVHAALLWTYGPRIMEIPAAMLDAAEERLFAAEVAR